MSEPWNKPPRDERYAAAREECQRTGLQLQYAKREGEASRWGATYRVIDGQSRLQLFESNSINEISRWLCLEVTQ